MSENASNTHPYQSFEGKQVICCDEGNIGVVLVHKVYFMGNMLHVEMQAVSSLEGSRMVKPIPKGHIWVACLLIGHEAYVGWTLEELP